MLIRYPKFLLPLLGSILFAATKPTIESQNVPRTPFLKENYVLI